MSSRHKRPFYQTFDEMRIERRRHQISQIFQALFILALGILIGLKCSVLANAEEPELDWDRLTQINFNQIAKIESSGNPLAHNKKDDSRGLFQITPICLREYNAFHKSTPHSPNDLWNPAVNLKIAKWYLNVRIPQMLVYYKIEDTIENRLISYNQGIGTLVHKKPICQITRNYLAKYRGEK